MITPRHIAIIMDGNGRWAKKKRLPRIEGHRRGSETAAKIIKDAADLGVEVLTLYTFSSENWKRPASEVDALMDLFEKSLKKNSTRIVSDNIVFKVIGRRDGLPEGLLSEIDKITKASENNTGIRLNLAVNYGGRQEIIDAVKHICSLNKEKAFDISGLDEIFFNKFLYTADIPDPDLIIRTSGEMRLSNFLLWQAAYSELYVTDTLWPDFGKKELEEAVAQYRGRNRRFGE
ncbi:MAG: isoprenyl transferase [Candidatus Omnitrophota bacterium]